VTRLEIRTVGDPVRRERARELTVEELAAPQTQRLIDEGCLSVPDLRGVVERHVTVRVRYLDRNGEPREDIRRGLTAGTFQHELDHLNGVLFLDRVRDPRTFMTWEQFERHYRDAFVARVAELPM
jgi:peptide deformylase